MISLPFNNRRLKMAMTTATALDILDEARERLNTGILETYMAIDLEPDNFTMEEVRAWSIVKPQFQLMFATK
jgi:hypothetical protein